eukprot:SAG11_NODE_323_length_10745_cov_18.203926_5_plen_87_part_00
MSESRTYSKIIQLGLVKDKAFIRLAELAATSVGFEQDIIAAFANDIRHQRYRYNTVQAVPVATVGAMESCKCNIGDDVIPEYVAGA